MPKIIRSNGKRNMECGDVKLIELYRRSTIQLEETKRDYDLAVNKNNKETTSFLSIYLSNIQEIKIALENEIQYRELEWED